MVSSTNSNPHFCCTPDSSRCHRLTIAPTATSTPGSTIELTLTPPHPRNQIVKIDIFHKSSSLSRVLLAECIFATAVLAAIATSVFLGFVEPQFRLGTAF
jgi:hypothetical protein